MKQINKTIRGIVCTALLMLSTTTAFANISADQLDKIIDNALKNRLAGIKAEIKGAIMAEQSNEQLNGQNVQGAELQVTSVGMEDGSENVATDSNADTNPVPPVRGTSVEDESVMQNYQSETYAGGMGDWIDPMMLLVYLAPLALLLALIFFFRNKGTKKRTHRQESEVNSEEKQEDGLENQMQNLQSNISAMKAEIDTLRNELSNQNATIKKLQKTIASPTPVPGPTPITPPPGPGPKPKETIYAARVAGDCFPDDSIGKADNKYVVAILTIAGDKGTFRINNNPEVQQNLLTSFSYGVANISIVKSQTSSPQKIETLREGKVVRDGSNWRVTQKAEIRLV